MSWQGTKLWGKEHWTTADANQFIYTNMVSVRRYQQTMKTFVDAGLTFTSTETTFASHTNLCPTAPDEPTRLVVMSYVITKNVSGIPLYLYYGIRDQGGTRININANGTDFGHPLMMYWCDPVNILFTACIIGFGNVASGTNPGFDLRVKTDNGTIAGTIHSMAWVVPIT